MGPGIMLGPRIRLGPKIRRGRLWLLIYIYIYILAFDSKLKLGISPSGATAPLDECITNPILLFHVMLVHVTEVGCFLKFYFNSILAGCLKY